MHRWWTTTTATTTRMGSRQSQQREHCRAALHAAAPQAPPVHPDIQSVLEKLPKHSARLQITRRHTVPTANSPGSVIAPDRSLARSFH